MPGMFKDFADNEVVKVKAKDMWSTCQECFYCHKKCPLIDPEDFPPEMNCEEDNLEMFLLIKDVPTRKIGEK
jgi:hypothetical protein